MSDLLVFAVIGAVVPDVIRVLAWLRRDTDSRGEFPYTDNLALLGIPIQVGLGAFAFYLAEPSSKLQAAAIGFSAPEFLTRILGAAVGDVAERELAQPGRRTTSTSRLFRWWRS